MMMPPGGTSKWEFIAAQVVAGLQNYDFLNLSTYTDIMVVLDDVTRSGAVTTQVQVSTDNGSTWKATSGDYQAISSAGVKTATAGVGLFQTGIAAARSGFGLISGFNLAGVVKVVQTGRTDFVIHLSMTLAAYNAVRVGLSAGTQNAGTIYVYGRK